MKRGFFKARNQPGGINLGLNNGQLWWQGYGGLGLTRLRDKLVTLVKVGDSPNLILLHCAGNDIGKLPCKKLRVYIRDVFVLIQQLLPEARILWSEVLPRTVWRYSTDNCAMERARKRLNSFAGKLAIGMGGGYIRHPRLCREWLNLSEDGVHPSDVGNSIYLQQLRKGIVEFNEGNSYIE